MNLFSWILIEPDYDGRNSRSRFSIESVFLIVLSFPIEIKMKEIKTVGSLKYEFDHLCERSLFAVFGIFSRTFSLSRKSIWNVIFYSKFLVRRVKLSKDTLMADAKQVKPETNELEKRDEVFRNDFPEYLEYVDCISEEAAFFHSLGVPQYKNLRLRTGWQKSS